MNLVDVFGYMTRLYVDPLPTKPFRAGEFVWATNGALLVAVQDDSLQADETPAYFLKALPYLTDAPQDAVAVNFASLVAFAGPVVSQDERCDVCDGSGRDGDKGHLCAHCQQWTTPCCESCEGSKTQRRSPRYVRIQKAALDAHLLALGLSLVPAQEQVLLGSMSSVVKRTGYHALLIVGDTWRIALMGCRDVAKDVPRLETGAAA